MATMAEAQELIRMPETLPAPAGPDNLLALAVANGASMETLERLMALKERIEAQQAHRAYTEAMAEFKRNPPEILKRKLVSFKTDKGKTEYHHAELGDVCNAVVSALAQHGFSHSWKVDQANQIEVTCVITHKLGHSESVMLRAGPDTSGGKNTIQGIASAVTYLERYTLLASVGLATNSMDHDGRGFDAEGNPYKGEDPRELSPEEQQERRKKLHDEAFARNGESMTFIRERIASGDVKAAVDEWMQLSPAEQAALWVAPKFGGWLTTVERNTMKEYFSKTGAAAANAAADREDLEAERAAKEQLS